MAVVESAGGSDEAYPARNAARDAPPPEARRGPFRPARLASIRRRLSGASLSRRFRLIDVVSAVFASLAALTVWTHVAPAQLTLAQVMPFAAGSATTVALLAALGGYRFDRHEPRWLRTARLGAALAGGALVVPLVARLGFGGADGWATWLAWTTTLLLTGQTVAWSLVGRWRREGRLTPNVVVVGATDNAARLIEAALATREIAVLGVFDDRLARSPSTVHGVPVLGDTQALLEHKVLPYVDRIVITVSPAAQARVHALIERLRVLPNAVTLFVDVEGEPTRAQTLSRLTAAPFAQVSGPREDEARSASKRCQDLVVGGLALVLLAPVMAAVALAVRLDGPGPILFRQRRYGFNNEPITIVKFRSMRPEAATQPLGRQVEPDDPRVTRVGRFIRATSFDELPQIFNVLSGEMSLVGPRPHAIGMLTGGEESNRLVAEYAWRNRMKPGITGWAQINGSRGPVDTPEAVRRRVALDIDYIERQSLALDLYILLMTLPRLLGDRAAVR